MDCDRTRLLSRGVAARAAGHWRDVTLLDHLAHAVAATPDKPAVHTTRAEDGTVRTLSYAELDRLSSEAACGLRRLGVTPGDVVSFQLPNWWEFTVLHLACLKAGAVSNPLMTIFRERELRFMLGHAGTRVLIAASSFRGHDHRALAYAVRDAVPTLAHVRIAGAAGAEGFDSLLGATDGADRRPDPDDVIQLLYTSGTTGEPKGVMHTSNTMLSNLVPFAARLGLGSADVIHMPSPLAHQLGFMYGVVLPVMLGATSVLQDVFAPDTMAAQIRDTGATFTMGATPFLNDLAEHVGARGAGTPTLRTFVSAGAPIPPALVGRARAALGCAVISAWGMSENGAVTTTRPDDSEARITGTDGTALDGMEVRIVDAQGAALPADTEGRLQVRGCSNFVGYLGRPDLDNTDADGWFDTGDLARMDAAGYIRICGRSKDIIIRGGENIPVVEVESLIFRHPAVAEVAVVGYPDPRLGERACAVVRLRAGATLDFAALRAHLEAQRMARHYMPERLLILDELPRTPSGKIQKFRLRALLAGAPAP